MGPDGGIARIRVYGEVTINPELIPADKEIDLLAIENGGMAISCSNKHYGHPRNLILPGRGVNMGSGWETARQPKRPAVYQKGPDGLMLLPGYDWSVLQLGISFIVVDALAQLFSRRRRKY
jgi:allantoicase